MTNDLRSKLAGLAIGLITGPREVAKKNPIAYLYNGVRLPKLPEWDREKYPYAVIVHGSSAAKYFYWFYISSQTAFWEDGVLYFTPEKSAFFDSQNYSDWGALADSSGTKTASGSIWSNADILNEDSTVYLTASEPVPVYE